MAARVGNEKGTRVFSSLCVLSYMCWGETFRGLGPKVALKFSVRGLAHSPRTVGRDYFPTDVWMGIRAFPTHRLTIIVLTFPTDYPFLFTGFPSRLFVTRFSIQQSVGENDFSQHTSVGNVV